MTVTGFRHVTAACLLVLLAGCGSPTVSGTPTTPTTGVPAVDACTLLNEQELASVGQKKDPYEKVDKRGEIGCAWVGAQFSIDLTVDAHHRLDEYLNKPQGTYVKSQQNQINGRRVLLTQAFPNNSECAVFLELGNGLFNIRLTTSGEFVGKADPCSDADRVAKVVEPKLPK